MISDVYNSSDMGPELRELTIVLVNFKCTPLVVDCLQSLTTQTYRRFQVALVDNTPGIAEFQTLQTSTKRFGDHFPIHYFKPKFNLGYAGGNNYALRRISSPYYYLLNCDTELPPDALEQAMTYFTAHPEIGMLGPKILYFEDPRYIWWAGAEIHPNSKYFSRHRGEAQLDHGQYDRPQPTDYVCGAALFVRKEVIDRVGYLDEIFFMYHEEAEWNYRTQQAGFKLFYFPQSRMLHKVHLITDRKWSDFSQNPFLTYLYTRNKVIFSVRHFSWIQICQFFAINISRTLLAALGKGILMHSPKYLKIQFRAIIMGIRIGMKRRTHRACGSEMLSEMRYLNSFTKVSRSTQPKDLTQK